jgi:hypothetical protein
MAMKSQLSDLEQFSNSHSRYTGPPVNSDYCPYTLITYPSFSLEARYISSKPIYFTIGAILIFAFTSAVFFGYDHMVERRQRKAMKAVARANALMLENARQAATAERELNDFIAYVLSRRCSILSLDASGGR